MGKKGGEKKVKDNQQTGTSVENEIKSEEVSAFWKQLKSEVNFDEIMAKSAANPRMKKNNEKSAVEKPKKPQRKVFTDDGGDFAQKADIKPVVSKPVKAKENLREKQLKLMEEKMNAGQKNKRIIFGEEGDVKQEEVAPSLEASQSKIISGGIESCITHLENDDSKPYSVCLFKCRQDADTYRKWYEEIPDEISKDESCSLSRAQFERVKAICDRLYDVEVNNYLKSRKRSRDGSWSKMAIQKGTSADRMAALAVDIQEAPMHNLHQLSELMKMLQKKTRREVVTVIASLEELFTEHLLPDRRLKTLYSLPIEHIFQVSGNDKMKRTRLLILHSFEAKLKELYSEFVTLLSTELLKDDLVVVKRRTLNCILTLLKKKQELESELLAQLVNKFGDPDRPTGASVCHLLNQLLSEHPMMKKVVVKHVDEFLLRPNLLARGQYYAVCFLSQIRLSRTDGELASKLIGIYFRIFSGSRKENAEKKPSSNKKKILKKKKRGGQTQVVIDEHAPQNSKLIVAILSGVNRAVPYATVADESLLKNMDTLYTIVHTGSLSIAIQALHLLYQLLMSPALSTGELTERFFAALYAKLLDSDILNVTSGSKLHLLLNVIYRSCKIDENMGRCRAFVKRLLQIGLSHTPCVAAGILYLVSELKKTKPTLLNNAISCLDDDQEENKSSDQKEENKDALRKQGNRYDPFYRNPLYANANLDSMWELVMYSDHYHPSVAIFAKRLLDNKCVDYDGDPLNDFTLARFLDRFIHRKPKQVDDEKVKKRKMTADDAEEGLYEAFDESKEVVRSDAEKLAAKQAKVRSKHGKVKMIDGEEVSDSEFDDYLAEHEDEMLEDEDSISDDDDDEDFDSDSDSGGGGTKRRLVDEIDDDDFDEEGAIDDEFFEDSESESDEGASKKTYQKVNRKPGAKMRRR